MKIAIIGTGIAGMGAAYELCKSHDITVYEKEDYVGGHSRTLDVQTPDGKRAVDTGFIVFNRHNYPHLTELFENLCVPIAKSNMSFGVSIDDGWLEYSGENLWSVFAQKRNVFNIRFLCFIRDIMRFNAQAISYVKEYPYMTIDECLRHMGLGKWFRDYYFLVMAGAIWSTSPKDIANFSAQSIVQFFANHGLLTVKEAKRMQWYTVKGGSLEYIKRLTQTYKDKIRLSTAALAVCREKNGVRVHDAKGGRELYDQVVLATHSDDALQVIEKPHAREQEILSHILYQSNTALLHSDPSLMPKRKAAWASWVYLSDTREDKKNKPTLSYWMNSLQPLNTNYPIILTLNATKKPAPNLIHDQYEFRHLLCNRATLNAQAKISEIQGKNRIWFCGAWLGHGFHEDGLKSGITVAKQIGTQFSREK